MSLPSDLSAAAGGPPDAVPVDAADEPRRDIWNERRARTGPDGRPLTGKAGVLEMIGRMRDDVTTAEILDAVAVRHMIEVGIRQADAGEVITHEEFRARTAKWRI